MIGAMRTRNVVMVVTNVAAAVAMLLFFVLLAGFGAPVE